MQKIRIAAKVSDLSTKELKTLIKETMLETLQELRLGEIDSEEQDELESMFGCTPIHKEYFHERELEL